MNLNEDAIVSVILQVKLVDLINLYFADDSFRMVLNKPTTINLLSKKYRFPSAVNFLDFYDNLFVQAFQIPISITDFYSQLGMKDLKVTIKMIVAIFFVLYQNLYYDMKHDYYGETSRILTPIEKIFTEADVMKSVALYPDYQYLFGGACSKDERFLFNDTIRNLFNTQPPQNINGRIIHYTLSEEAIIRMNQYCNCLLNKMLALYEQGMDFASIFNQTEIEIRNIDDKLNL